MATRLGRRDVNHAFARLCRMLGKLRGHAPGNWEVDYNAAYGGYVVHEYLEHHAVTPPLGDKRRSAAEFCRMGCDIEKAIDVMARDKKNPRL